MKATMDRRALARVRGARLRLAGRLPYRVVCAWCSKTMATRYGRVSPGTVSHGLCATCAASMEGGQGE